MKSIKRTLLVACSVAVVLVGFVLQKVAFCQSAYEKLEELARIESGLVNVTEETRNLPASVLKRNRAKPRDGTVEPPDTTHNNSSGSKKNFIKTGN